MKLKYHSVVQKQGCRTLGEDEKMIAKEVWETAEMGNRNIRNGPWSGGELQVKRKRTSIEAWERQHQEMGVEIIRNGWSKHQKWVCKASEMGRQNIRNGLWSGRGTPCTEEAHQYRNLGKESIRKRIEDPS